MDQENNLGTPNPTVPPPQQQVPTPVSGNQSNQRRGMPVVVLVVIVVFVVCVGVFAILMLRKGGTSPVQTSTTPTPTTEISPTSTVIEESFEITLEKNEKTEIDLNGISLTFISSEVPGDTCFDCISTTVIEAEVNGETKDVLYECGGITGECTIRQDVFGIGLELVQQVDSNTLRMKVHYKK